MLNARRALLLIFGGSLLIFYHCDRPPKKYYRINSRWTKEVMRLTPADIDNDGVDEIVQCSEAQIDIVDQSLRSYYHSFRMTDYSGGFYLQPKPGVRLDSVSFFISRESSDSSYFERFDHITGRDSEIRRRTPLFAFSRLHTPHADNFDQGIAYITDFRARNSNLCLFLLNTAFRVSGDRGLLGYDMERQQERWRFLCGPQLSTLQFADIDGDSLNEIIIGTYAPANGAMQNGSTDDSSYVFVLDDDGSELWRKSFSGRFSGAFAYPGRFLPQGVQIAVMQFQQLKEDKTADGVSLLDARSGHVLTPLYPLGGRIGIVFNIDQNLVNDFDADGLDEIVISSSDGYVRLLDENLRLAKISKGYGKEIFIEAVGDLDGDGLPEIVCRLPKEKLVVLDHNLNELTTFPLEMRFSHNIHPVRNGNNIRLLLQSNFSAHSTATLTNRLLELQKSKIPFETYTGAAKFFWWGLGGFGLLGVLLISFSTRKRFFTRTFLRLLMQAKLFDSTMLITAKGVVRSAGAHWLQLANMPAEFMAGRKLSALKAIPHAIRAGIEKSLKKQSGTQFRLNVEQAGRKTPIVVQMDYIKTLALWRATLRFISQENFISNIKHWAAAAQKLAHGIKNPLTSMKLNLDELASHLHETQANKDEMEYVESISQQIERLRRMADGFTRFIEFDEPELAAADANEFIETTMAQLYDDMPKDILITLDLSPALPPALIHAEQLRCAFENVVFNAVQSIQGHGAVIIQTAFVQLYDNESEEKRDFVEICIQDNGIGIEPELLSKVTDPYYTTKKQGTGLGLNLVVKIMQMHGGEFDIQSTVGEGTIVYLRLRTAA